MAQTKPLQPEVQLRYEKVIDAAIRGNMSVVNAARSVGYSDSGAMGLMSKPAFLKLYRQKKEDFFSKNQCSKSEILNFLTLAMRGEILDTMGLEASLADRIKAAELLGKAADLWNVNKGAKEIDVAKVVQNARIRARTASKVEEDVSIPASPEGKVVDSVSLTDE